MRVDVAFLLIAFAIIIGVAIERYEEAEREAAYWNRRCAAWTAAWGLAVWREGHPADREKLCQRRLWRRRAAMAREALEKAVWEFRAAIERSMEGHEPC
jgi:hypothetical protein